MFMFDDDDSRRESKKRGGTKKSKGPQSNFMTVFRKETKTKIPSFRSCLHKQGAKTRAGAMPDCRDSRLLNLRQTVVELRPVGHDVGRAVIFQELAHLILFVAGLVDADVADDVDARPHGAQGATLTILDGDALGRVLADGLAGEQVNGRVRLRRRVRQGRGGAEDVVRREKLGLVDFLDGSLDSAQRRRRHDGHAVLFRSRQFLQFRVDARARLRFLLERRDHPVFFLLDVALQFRRLHREVVFLLEAAHHAAEVLPDEVGEELWARVAHVDLLFLQDFVGEFGAGFECQFFRQDERIVAIEKKLRNLAPQTSSVQ